VHIDALAAIAPELQLTGTKSYTAFCP